MIAGGTRTHAWVGEVQHASTPRRAHATRQADRQPRPAGGMCVAWPVAVNTSPPPLLMSGFKPRVARVLGRRESGCGAADKEVTEARLCRHYRDGSCVPMVTR